ncbi:MAG: Ig-like domain-containing protein, partial [Mycobacterium sp.]
MDPVARRAAAIPVAGPIRPPTAVETAAPRPAAAVLRTPAAASAAPRITPPRTAAPAAALDALVGITPGGAPVGPPESPAVWTALAAARREIGRPEPPRPAATFFMARALGPNQPPVIRSVNVGTPAPGTGVVSGTVIATDPNRDKIAYRATTSSKGAVAITNTGLFTYTPTAAARHAAAKVGAPADAKSDTVTVTVTDARRAATSTTARVQILPRNSVPVASAAVGTPSAATGAVTGSVQTTDSDGDVPSYALSATATKGTVTLNAATGAFTYTPTAPARHKAAAISATAADRSDTFTVRVSDGYGGQAVVPVTVSVGPRNTAPVASSVVGKPDPLTGLVRGTVTATDADKDTLSYTASAAANGTVALGAAGAFTYTPSPAARTSARNSATVLTDSFTVTVNDGHGGTAAVRISATVAPSDRAPVAGTPVLSTDLTTGVVTGNVNAVDPDGDSLTYVSLNASTAKGAVAVTNTGAFTYTPTDVARQNAGAPNATGADKADVFTVSVTDKFGATSSVSVNVPVTPATWPS